MSVPMTVEELKSEMENLNEEERAELLRSVVIREEADSETAESESALFEELDRRYSDIVEGRVQTRDAGKVIADLRARLKERRTILNAGH